MMILCALTTSVPENVMGAATTSVEPGKDMAPDPEVALATTTSEAKLLTAGRASSTEEVGVIDAVMVPLVVTPICARRDC